MYKELIAAVAGSLAERGIPYMIIGGQAVLVHGEPRLTRDIDITLGIGLDRLEEVAAINAALLLRIIPEDYREFARRTMVLPVRHEDSGIRIDYIFSFTPYERQAIERAGVLELEGTEVRFCSPEDLIIHKIFAHRPRDLEDARSVILRNPGLDREYVSRWLAEFDASVPGAGLLAMFESL